MKNAIQARKMAYKAWRQNRAGSLRRESLQPTRWKSEMQSWEYSGHKLDCNCCQVDKMFWQTNRQLWKKKKYCKIHQRQHVVLLRHEEDILGRWRKKLIHYHITGHTRGSLHLWEKNTSTAAEVLLAVKLLKAVGCVEILPEMVKASNRGVLRPTCVCQAGP